MCFTEECQKDDIVAESGQRRPLRNQTCLQKTTLNCLQNNAENKPELNVCMNEQMDKVI